MKTTKSAIHEPLFHITKRDGIVWWKSWIVRIIAFIAALLVCSVVILLLTGYNPVAVYVKMFESAFRHPMKVWQLARDVSILLCISLAVTPAFKMRFWNIGAEGQSLIGGLAAAAMMIYFGNTINPWLLIPLMLIACMLAGMVWGVIPAIFKARYGTNETLFTLMMNYVAMQLVSYFIILWENPKGSNHIGIININTSGGWLPSILGQKYLFNIIIISLLTIGMYIYLKYSKHGYEIAVVGESENTARYIGINVKKVIIRTMALSGALCGVAGFLLVAGTHHTHDTNTVGGMGFTSIMVSWLAKFNPLAMILVSFLITFLNNGAGEITSFGGLDQSAAGVSDILTGIIILFIIGSEFFVQYKINFRTKHKEVA